MSMYPQQVSTERAVRNGPPLRVVRQPLEAQEWDEHVRREAQHQARIEAAYDFADACHRLGEYEQALRSLDRADALSGGPSPAGHAQRLRLARALVLE